ncbi:ABC transporter ATP-binding protein [Selenomonas ruminis]|uniref:ABC transporter ATP-binding protein n=1 Tax=Selenomonas ruminis TaxID=2593411 RepID=A0A5D6W0J7_9FIRM|nr:ABC transporter ATP-binding protein [Selenomonas sp. mPRGC5]TYZ21410.1 ABC transporter ATP-binding protein [Selenomonas sp. mPRGC5]
MALTVEKLGVSIAHKVILHDLSVKFPSGKRTAVIGPNGAGKSTLLRTAAGLNSNYCGTVRLGGTDIRTISRRAMAKKLAILPQGATVPADTTVRQLVDYGRFPYRSWFRPGNAQKDREAVEWAMGVTKVEQFANRQVQTLSGGERQRAFLAMALAQQPEFLLLDEPTTYLDIAHQLEVMEIVTHIKEQYGMTVVMVLHDINHALQYADEIAVLTDHKVIAQGAPRDILTVDMLAKVFHVKADIFTNSQGAAVLSPVELVR